MIGTVVNAATVAVGGLIGLMFKQHISTRFSRLFFQAIGLFTLCFGVQMAFKMNEIIVVIPSLVIGAFVGEWLKIDRQVEKLGAYCNAKIKIGNDKFAEGLTAAFLLFCTGSLTVLGAISEGLGQGHQLLFTKAMLDGFSAILLASTFGISVSLAAIPLLIFQGSITLLAMLLGAAVSMPVINEMTAVGGILMTGVALTILEVKQINVINLLPSLLIVCLLTWAKIHLFS